MKIFTFIITFFIAFSSNAQKDLHELLEQYNSHNVPYISVQELAMPKTKVLVLDAREQKEYDVSHLKDAIYVGYNNFNLDSIQHKIGDKDKKIVVYCSVGIRSEIVADKLKKAGFTNVYNLYGGIFEWKNKSFPIYNSEQKATDSIHAFSKPWSKWVKNGIKIYD